MGQLDFTGIGAVPAANGASGEAEEDKARLEFEPPSFLTNSAKAAKTTPTQSAFDRDLAKTLGLRPYVVNDTQRKSLTEQATQRKMDADTKDAPVTRGLLEFDRELNALASDDTDNLRRAEGVARQLSFTGAFGGGVDVLQGLGWRFIEAGAEAVGAESLEAAAQAGAEANFSAPSSGTKQRFIKIQSAGDFFQWLKQTAGEQLPLMAPAFVGAAAGAAIGSVVPVIGTAIGGALGAFIPSFILGVGETQNAIKERNAGVEAPGAAFGAGALIGLLDSALPGHVGSLLRRSFGGEAAEKALKTIAARVLVEGAKGSAIEGVTETIQEVIAETAAAAATDTDIGDITEQLIEAFAAGVFMGGGTTTTATAASEVIRSRRVKNTLEAYSELAGNSKLRGRAADKHAEVMAAQMKAGGVDSVYVPVTALLQFAGKQEGGVAQALQDLGVSESLADVIDTAPDAKVKISAENFSSAVLGTEGFKILSRHLTVNPEAQSFQEAADSIASDDEIAVELAEELEAYEAADDLKQRVKETIAKLKDNAAEAIEKAPTDVNAVLMDVANRVQARKGSVADQIKAGRVALLDDKIEGIDREIASLENQLELANKADASTVRIQNAIDKLVASRDAADTEQANLTLEARKAGLLDEFNEDVVAGTTGAIEVEPLPGLADTSLGPDPEIHEVARKYMQKAQLPFRRAAEYVKVNVKRGQRIAAAYEKLKDTPTDPKVIEAYDALIKETLAQWEAIKDLGIDIQFIKTGQPNPYPTPQDAMIDLRDNRHLWVSPTDQGFGQGEDNGAHPMLAPTDQVVDDRALVANDVFRIVHDVFGHGLEGNGFGPSGEENAWQAHVRMYSPLAARAMTTETRGQNSWVNYGPKGEANRANPRETVFAEQKAGLLPLWVTNNGLAEDQGVEDNTPVTEPPVNSRGRIEFVHYTNQPNLERLDPSFEGTSDIRGGEEARRSDPGYPNRTYVGLAEGRPGGYQKETGLGDNRVEGSVAADALYDFKGDPDGLYEQAKAKVIADREEAGFVNQNNTAAQQGRFDSMYEGFIKDAGYNGYWAMFDSGMAGALFGKTALKPAQPSKADQALGKTIIQVKGKVLQALNVKITRESVRAAREGFKAALAVGKSLTVRKGSISKQIEKNKWLTDKQKLVLTGRLNRATSDEQLSKTATAVQARAAVLVEKERKKQIKTALKKELGKVQSKKQGGKDTGRMDADTQAFVDEATEIMALSADHAAERLEILNSGVEESGGKKSVLPPEDTLTSTLLAMAANSDDLNVTDAENALLDIVKVIQLGKAEGLKRVLHKRARKNAAVEEMREAVTQGQPVGELSTTGFFNRLKRNKKELSTWLGSMHNGWDEILDKVINKAGVEATELIESLRMTKYVQGHKARTRKWQAELEQIGIDTFRGVTGPQALHEKHVADSDVQDFGVFENLNGKKTRLQYSKSQVRKLWMEMQDPSIAEVLHAENGMAWTIQMRQTLFDTLTDEDKTYARAQLDFYKKLYPQVNAVYRKMYGVNLPFNEFYSPIQRDKGDVEEGMNAEFGSDLVLVDEVKFRKAIPSQVKNRTGSIAPLKIHSDVGVMQRYMHDMSWFIESTEQVMHLKSVFKNEQLKKDIAHHHGASMNRFIDSFLEDFGTGYAARGMVAEAGFNTINRLYSGSVLALKGTIATKQLVSWFAMADNIPAASFMASHADFFKNPAKVVKFLYNSSPVLQARGSSLDFELAKIGAANQPLFQWKKGNQWESLKFALIKFGDRVPIYAGGWAVYQHTLKTTGSHDKAIAAFEDAMATTQQSTDIDKLSSMQRMGAIGRTLTMFMTARMALLRGELRAVRQVRRGKITYREFGKRFAYYHFIMPMAIQYISSGFEWDTERQFVAGALGQLNSVVIFGDLMMLAVEQMMAVDGFQPSDEMPITGMMKDLWDGVQDAFAADDAEELLLAIAEIGGAVGHVSGQPVDQVVNMGKGVDKIIDGDVEEGAKLLFGFSERVAEESSR